MIEPRVVWSIRKKIPLLSEVDFNNAATVPVFSFLLIVYKSIIYVIYLEVTSCQEVTQVGSLMSKTYKSVTSTHY